METIALGINGYKIWKICIELFTIIIFILRSIKEHCLSSTDPFSASFPSFNDSRDNRSTFSL